MEDIRFYLTSTTSIVADTCFIAHEGFAAVLAKIAQLGHPILVPEQVLEVELPNLMRNKPGTENAAYAAEGIRLLREGVETGAVMVVYQGRRYSSVDLLILAEAPQLMESGNLILLTEDNGLSDAIHMSLPIIQKNCMVNKDTQLLIMQHGQTDELVIRLPMGALVDVQHEGASQFWLGVPLEVGSARASERYADVFCEPGNSYQTLTGGTVRLEKPAYYYSDRMFCDANSSRMLVFPTIKDTVSSGMAWKLQKLYELGRKLQFTQDTIPILLPDDLVLDDDRAVIGSAVTIPQGFVPIREIALDLFALERPLRVQLAVNLAEAVSFAARMGVLFWALNSNYIFVHPQTLQVRLLLAISEVQVGPYGGSTYASNPLMAVSLGMKYLQTSTAIAPVLAKMMAQLVNGGTADLELMHLDKGGAYIFSRAMNGKRVSARALATALQHNSGFSVSSHVVKASRRQEQQLGLCANPSCADAGKMIPLVNNSRYCACCSGQIIETRVCKTCGKEFDITRGMAERFARNSLILPLRCKACRSLKNSEASHSASATAKLTGWEFSSI